MKKGKLSQIRRGFEVFRQICINCHSFELFKLSDLNFIGFTTKQTSVLIKGYKINNYFNLPYKSLNQAKHFNNGVVPPDLSLITKYKSIEWVYEVLTGYIRNHLQSHNNFFYNKRFEFGITAMRPPLTNGCIKHNFNVPLTVHQYSRDISEFLHWVSEPWINSRKKLILPVLIFFIFMHTLLLTNLSKYTIK